MRITLSLFALLLLSSCNNSNPITGYWVGTMEMNGIIINLK